MTFSAQNAVRELAVPGAELLTDFQPRELYWEESNSWFCLTNLICNSEMTPRGVSPVRRFRNTCKHDEEQA